MIIHDDEFGEISLRRSRMAKSIKISIAPNGKLKASLPLYAPDFSVKRLIRQNRDEIRDMIVQHNSNNVYKDGLQVGKSHALIFKKAFSETISITDEAQHIIVRIPEGVDPYSISSQAKIRDYVAKILRKQAKSYLPRRLEYLADKHNFSYERVRFSHAGSRWGSCSSNGTISLNISLMNLPHRLIDYVLIHELCHTRQMNHSDKFWTEVEHIIPDYKIDVKEIKKYNPTI